MNYIPFIFSISGIENNKYSITISMYSINFQINYTFVVKLRKLLLNKKFVTTVFHKKKKKPNFLVYLSE